MHHVPALPHDFSEGVPNLMSAGGFEIAWTEYMTLTIEKLNALTAGTFGEEWRKGQDTTRKLRMKLALLPI